MEKALVDTIKIFKVQIQPVSDYLKMNHYITWIIEEYDFDKIPRSVK